MLPTESIQIALFGHSGDDIEGIRRLIQTSGLEINLVHSSNMDDILTTPDIIVIVSQSDDAVAIASMREFMSRYPLASLLLICDSAPSDAARYCLQQENGYCLLRISLELLPDLLNQIVSKQARTRQRISAIKWQQQAIVNLATSTDLMSGDWYRALQEITRVTSQTLAVSRVGIWLYSADKSSIICEILYSASDDSFQRGMELTSEFYPGYFKGLHDNRVIVADDAFNTPETCEFAETYLIPENIKSMLDAPIRIQGEMVGVVCHEHLKTQRHWTYDDQQFAAAIADLVAQTMENRERRRAEASLRRRERYLKEAEAIAHLGNFEYTVSDQSLTWSDEMYRIFGREPGSPVTLELYRSLLNRESYKQMSDAAASVIRNAVPYEIEHEIMLADGTTKHLFNVGRPILDKTGKVTKIFGIVQDITALKRAEQHRVESEINRQRVAYLKDIIGTMTHDMKTPLASIKSTAYLLRKIEDKQKQQPHFANLDSQVNRLTQMIDDILILSRLEYSPELQLQTTDLSQLIQDLAQQVHSIAIRKHIELELNLDSQIQQINVAPAEFMRALLNLVENALNYTPQGGRVMISTRREGDNVLCEVRDTGIGISPEDINRIFDQFYRADNARSFASGTGLGLAIVRRIIELHQGEISVQSEEGSGTSITLILSDSVPVPA